MILSAAVFYLAVMAPQDAKVMPPADAKAVTLNRVFSKGEKLQYSVKSSLHIEQRPYGLETFMPEDLDLNYKFTTEVRELKNDGVAVIHYQRPTIVQVQGETWKSPSKTTVEKLDMNYDLTVSAINKILDEKDLNPPKKKTPKKAGGSDDGDGLRAMGIGAGTRQDPLGALLGQFIGEMYRLALNVGPMDSSLDFAPKLPLDDVKVGDTWKETVGYQPQKLKGTGKQAVQRLDYTFTYKGLVTVNGKQFHRVSATLDLTTDLATFINQLADAKPDETGLKSIPMTLKQSIDYDLDPVTKRTVLARSKAVGGFKINVTSIPDEPAVEQKLSGSTEMSLVAIGTAQPIGAGASKTTTKHGGQAKR